MRRILVNLGLVGLLLSPLSCSNGKKMASGASDSDLFGGGNGQYDDVGSMGLPGMGPVEEKALTNTVEALAQTAPDSGMIDFSKPIDDAFAAIQQAEKKGQDTTQMRYALMGKMLTECANSVSQYTPAPGEPYLGKWAYSCGASYPVFSNWDMKGEYASRDSAGIPLGNPKISYKGILYGTPDGKTLTGAGSGTVTVQSSGKGEANGNWVGYIDGDAYPYTWKCSLTDQPSAATGACVSTPLWEKCPSTPGKLVTSSSPIPQKYAEAMKKMGACYRKAITMVSPILWGYMATLPPSTQGQLQAALYMQ